MSLIGSFKRMFRFLLLLAITIISIVSSAKADDLEQKLQIQARLLSTAIAATKPTVQLGASQFLHALSNELSSIGAQLAPATNKVTLVQQDPRYIENASLLYGLQQTPSGIIATTQESNRIWGGISTTGYTDVVALIVKEDNNQVKVCSGIAISPNTVLTAAHCVCANVTDVYEGSSIFTPTYKHKPVARPGLAGQMRGCTAPRSIAADIGLIQIADTFRYTTPVTLASSDTINNMSVVRAVGFGETETGQIGQKKYADIPVASADCDHLVRLANNKIIRDQDFYGCSPGFELVAGQSSLNRDTCYGDSGGPIFGYVAKGGGSFDEYLVGITSRGISGADSVTDCGQGGVYTRIDGPVLSYLRNQRVAFSIQP